MKIVGEVDRLSKHLNANAQDSCKQATSWIFECLVRNDPKNVSCRSNVPILPVRPSTTIASCYHSRTWCAGLIYLLPIMSGSRWKIAIRSLHSVMDHTQIYRRQWRSVACAPFSEAHYTEYRCIIDDIYTARLSNADVAMLRNRRWHFFVSGYMFCSTSHHLFMPIPVAKFPNLSTAPKITHCKLLPTENTFYVVST